LRCRRAAAACTHEQGLRHRPGCAEQKRGHGDERRELTLLREHRHARGLRARDHLDFDRLGLRDGALAIGFDLLLKTFELGALGLSRCFELSQLGFLGRVGDDLGLQLIERFLDAVFPADGDLGFLVEAVDELGHFARELALQTGQIGIQLLHTRMAGQQRGREFGNLPLDTHALLHQVLDQRRLLHVGQRVGRAELHHLARRLGAGFRLAAGGGGLGKLGGQLRELLLIEAGILRSASEFVDLAAILIGFGLRRRDFGRELGDFLLQDLLLIVDLDHALGCKRLPVGVAQPVGDVGGEFRIGRGHAHADEAAFLGRIDFKLATEHVHDPVALALAGARAAKADQPHDGVDSIDGTDLGVEFGPFFELQLVGDPVQQLGRLQRLDVSVDRRLIHLGGDGVGGRRILGIGECAGACLGHDRQFGLALIFGRQH